jgi:hypothetical protein
VFCAALVALCWIACSSSARADVISGPTLNSNEINWPYAGIGFVANVDSVLTSFVFQNQGNSDTVELLDPVGTILDSILIPGGNTSYVASVNWSLVAGHQYYLLKSTATNSLYTYWGQPGPSDTEISMTDTGIFSTTNDASSGIGFFGTTYWSSFNNITTASTSDPPGVPEPTAMELTGIGTVCILLSRSLRSRRHARAIKAAADQSCG